jgi:hypothetical protein
MDMLEWMTNLHKNGTNVGMDYQSTQERYKRWDGWPIYTRTVRTLEWMTNLHKNGTNVGMDDQSTQERYKRNVSKR